MPRCAQQRVGQRPDWPLFAERLDQLSRLASKDSVESTLQKAAAALVAGNAEEALRLLDSLQDAPDRRILLIVQQLRAEALHRLGRNGEAIEQFNDVIAHDPNERAYVGRARALYFLGRFREAREDFTDALKLNPDAGHAWLGRGLTHVNLNEPRQAIEDLTRAEQFDPNEVIIYWNRGAMLMLEGKVGAAIKDLRKALEIEPEQNRTRLWLAEALLKGGSPEEARQMLEEARARASEVELTRIRRWSKRSASWA